MINLQQLLQEDDKYKQILDSLKPEERKALEAYMANFMSAWQTGVFDPIIASSQDKDLSEELRKEAKKKFGKSE